MQTLIVSVHLDILVLFIVFFINLYVLSLPNQELLVDWYVPSLFPIGSPKDAPLVSLPSPTLIKLFG